MMKYLSLVMLFAGITLAAELSDADKKAIAEANKFVQRANEQVNKNSLPRAKTEYLKALKIFPQHVDALYNLAVVCEKLGQNDEAIEHYRRYLEIRPDDADVWTQLGVRYDGADKKVDAQAAYEKALSIDPKFGLAHHNLGVLLKEEGKLDAAQLEFETYVRQEEEAGRRPGDGYYSLGVLDLQRGRVKDAKMLLQKAIDTDPSIPHYNNALGDVYLTEKQPDLAVAAYRKALDRDPKYVFAYSGLGDAYRQLNDTAKAEESYRKALELRKDYVLVHYKLGSLFETTNPTEAIKQFETYLASGKTAEFQTEAKAKIEKLKQANTK